jgi:hypothetical protein
MKNLFNYFKILLLSIFMISCSDSLGVDDNVKEKDKGSNWDDYMKLDTHNIWYYDDYKLEPDIEKITTKNDRYTIVSEKVEKFGKVCYKLDICSISLQTVLANYYQYFESSRFYASTNMYWVFALFSKNNSPRFFYLKDTLILHHDFEAKGMWQSYYEDLSNKWVYVGTHNNKGIYFMGSINISGEMGNDTSITIFGNEFLCKKVIQYIDVQGTVLYDDNTTEIGTYRFYYYSYYAKGIGWAGLEFHFPAYDWGFGYQEYSGWRSWTTDFVVE